jgi:hypothetical protein
MHPGGVYGVGGAESSVQPKTLWYMQDALGSTVGLVEKDGRVSARGIISQRSDGLLARITYKGHIKNPQSQNLYTYVVNNPINWIDPSRYSAKCNKKCARENLLDIIEDQYGKPQRYRSATKNALDTIVDEREFIRSIGGKYLVPAELIAGIILISLLRR